MKTKFIGLEGYQEIEHVSSKKKKAKKLNTAQKTVRFIKRAVSLGKKKLLNRKKKNTAVLKKNTAVQRTKKTNQTSVLERQYLQSRTAATGSGSAMESLKYLKNKPASKTYQHSAPEEPRKRGFVKKKAVLAVAACLTAIMLSCVTVASALDSPAKNAQKNNNSAPKAAALPVATADEVKYDLDTPGFCVNASLSSLYIDGELIGTTNESEALDNALDQVLLDARAAYDDTTTTEFLNVKVEKLGFDNTALMTADELMEKAEGRFSIKLETDWSYDIELDYDTDVTYDEDEDSDYEKVVTEGEKGTEQINTRLTYIDGEFADAEVLDTKVTKEPVTEEIIKGCKQGKKESSEETSGSGDFIWPFPHTHSISSLFEWRWGRMHQGIDIAGGGDYGQPIVAADSGKVTWAGNDGGGYGNYVMIDHGNGYMTVYAHACEVACSTGDYVSQGDTIAYCGSTGNSTGPHVHFEIRVDGTQVDPLGYVS
ncbi:G5 domain-containing protein [Ruminococcaceae bacterium P7]|nr:G5 domain-containing protein [Ruminococcaceae bacterium P7]